jgi:large subunit ribosomal protein L25
MRPVRQARKELGVRVKGTGVGQVVKGHIRERRMVKKDEARRKAMEEMPQLIHEWKLVSILVRMEDQH